MKSIEGQRVLIIGGSSGIGRALASALVAQGARVAVAARRLDRLEQLVNELGGRGRAIECDVCNPSDCERVVTEAAQFLGGLDAIVYTAGAAVLSKVAEADLETWRRALDINLIGASLVTRAALPELQRTRGRAIYLSSITAEDRPPRTGLGLYAAAKTALNTLVRVWQAEHHEVSFTRVSVGDTGSTDMAADWDATLGKEAVADWIARGYLFGRAMKPIAVADHIVGILASDEAIEVTRIVPRFPESVSD